MLNRKVDFLKGHMGGNEIILLYGDEIPKGREIETVLPLLDSPNIRGHQAGLFYNSKRTADLKVKILDLASKSFVTMCGGLTQVLGKALTLTAFSKHFNILLKKPITMITLETSAGLVPLKIQENNSGSGHVLTGMRAFVDESYKLGVQPIKVGGIDAMKVGKFLVVNRDKMISEHHDIGVEKLDTLTLQILKSLQKDFDSQGHLAQRNADFALYDLNPKRPGNTGRLIFPHNIPAGHIEPACGTGTIAVGIAMVASEKIGVNNDQIELFFESGGSPSSIGGPDITELKLKVEDGKVVDAYFSHSLVEILATGKLWI